MFSPTRFLRTAVITVGLGSLAFVLCPTYVAPLWDWAKFVGTGVGNDPLPSFERTQQLSGLALAGFVLVGIAYNLWRDRRFRNLQAEYAYRTNANHLKEKVYELEAQLSKTVSDRDKWQESYLALTKQHAAALVTSKEHEIRSEFGRADRELLAELRKEFDTVVRARGNMEGFREAMHFFLTNFADAEKPPEVAVVPPANGSIPAAAKKRAALPFVSS